MKLKTSDFLSPLNVLIGISCLVLGIVAVMTTKWFPKNGLTGLNTVGSETIAATNSPVAGRQSPAGGGTKKDSSRPAPTKAAIYTDPYAAYLDTICRRLTPAQEDRVLADSNRDPRVLIGLALAGSARAKQWLEEALRKAPDDPLVHYAILARGDTGFDRLRSARDLVRLAPNDAESFYAAASESSKAGDRESALAYLRQTTERDDFTSLYQAIVEAKVNAYRLAGYPEQDARMRIYLESGAALWDLALINLNDALSPVDRNHVIAPGNEEVAALLLDAAQKALYSPGRTLNSYLADRDMEISYLKAFLRSSVEAGNSAVTNQYLATPAAEMLAAASAERKEFYSVGLFYRDKPGVFQRLTKQEQIELIGRIQKDGEVPAYRWAYQVRPDIFRSPDFPPHGFTKKVWAEYINQRVVE